ncbi:unnamed protein product [Protopolystoma xenopodis]|uniref:Uncharacterized protein n=1 Tax=Protopolystoma xenopodis TaxID=117903 RepID=A0A3S5BUZ0_9PLAT|nr:unnamed protein product [Protopolystoma xenopodis]
MWFLSFSGPHPWQRIALLQSEGEDLVSQISLLEKRTETQTKVIHELKAELNRSTEKLGQSDRDKARLQYELTSAATQNRAFL